MSELIPLTLLHGFARVPRSGGQVALAPTDCAAAQKHFGKGVKILAGAPKSVNFDRARAGAKQQWITGIGGVPGCRPDAGTPPLP
ncbi:hypothetical protein [Ferrovum sp.]|uniref:hypothetical protein n=1 Tax=Ferrovum sp. TaxID=2609467 RepID=UPI00261FBD4C|nr:hypothetical protein [Ferrovum sp.]